MDKLFNILNQTIIYSVCYALMFIFYGFVFYVVFKFSIQIIAYVFQKIKSDWDKWHNSKKKACVKNENAKY